MTKVLIVGHADGDGHLITEQTRRNLSLVPSFDVSVVVDPERTQGHQAWERLDRLPEIETADFVFFMDLMFSPSTFVKEARSLLNFVRRRPEKQFFVVDHHPLPLKRLYSASNLHAVYRPEVFECTFGPRTGLMVLAALCERQKPLVADRMAAYDETFAKGVRRAAAPGGQLAGPPLLSLLEADRWDLLYRLGSDDVAYHRFVRGRRLAREPKSETLVEAENTAEIIQSQIVNGSMPKSDGTESGRISMPYDAGVERFFGKRNDRPHGKNEPSRATDLETLVTILEVAALSLTDHPEAEFSADDLIAEARTIAGDGVIIDDQDVKNVLEKASFLERTGRLLRVK